jgi:hypothetical protein
VHTTPSPNVADAAFDPWSSARAPVRPGFLMQVKDFADAHHYTRASSASAPIAGATGIRS